MRWGVFQPTLTVLKCSEYACESRRKTSRAFEVKKNINCYFVKKKKKKNMKIISLDKTLLPRLGSFSPLKLHLNCILEIETHGHHLSPLYGEHP